MLETSAFESPYGGQLAIRPVVRKGYKVPLRIVITEREESLMHKQAHFACWRQGTPPSQEKLRVSLIML